MCHFDARVFSWEAFLEIAVLWILAAFTALKAMGVHTPESSSD